MGAAAVEVQSMERPDRAGRRSPKTELRKPPYAETDVLVLEEVCLGVRCSMSQLYKVLPKLKVSYLLGEHSPRVVWRDVLEQLSESSTN